MAGETASSGLALRSASGRWLLVACVLGSAMVMLDGTVVNVALPRLGADLRTDLAGLEWVLSGYLLTLASFILLGGALGDRLGRRRIFLIGVVWFALGSLLCGVSPNVGVLVVARLLQGIGGALLTPASLAIIQTSLRPTDRGPAIGAWAGFTGLAGAVGPFLGGWVVQASWRWIFLLNLPLAVAVVVLTAAHVPDDHHAARADQGTLDVPGALLGALALGGLSYGLIEQSWLVGVAGGVVGAAFLITESKHTAPMLPLGIFRNSQFSAVNAVTFGLYGSLSMLMFMLTVTLQGALGYSPLLAGAATVPVTVLMLAGSARAGALAQRIGPRFPMAVGTAVVAVALVLFTRVAPGHSYLSGVLPGVIVFGLGLTLTVAPLTATAMASVTGDHAGVASGVNNAVSRTAGLIAIALVPLMAGIDPQASVSNAALVDGFHRLMWIGAAVVAGCAALAWLTIRSDALAQAPEPEQPPVSEREPCFHCPTAGTPLAVHASRHG